MNLDVSQHPEYPLRTGRRAGVESRVTTFLDVSAANAPEVDVLRQFLHLSDSFAFLERLVQGHVLCDLPAHASRILSARLADPEDEGERLAEAEEDLLDWTAGSIDSLAEALDTIGVKVFLRAGDERDGAGTAVAPPPPGRDLFGAFCFYPDAGPAILAGVAADAIEATFALAHEFGHLVADVNPYVARFCRWDPRSFTNRSSRPEETRADRFARALLMPASAVLRALHDMGPVSSAGYAGRVELLAAIFSAPEALVRRRLADLGVLLADGPGAREAAGAARRRGATGGALRSASKDVNEGPAPAAEPLLPLPERYVNLALAAYGGRVLSVEVLALFLRTTEDEARRVADWAGIYPNARSYGED